MKNIASNQKTLTVSILSLSLLTVMAGAAVAPALGVIREYFADSDQLFVQMIISMPALFIVLTNLLFGRLAEKFGSRTLVIAGLMLYTVGGCAAGLFDSIGLVLAMRALVGIGVGIIMPLSTGLLSYYFPPERQEGLMGWSSAMNQMGGVAATLISGLLANISWRLSFLVYLMGLISIVLCLAFMPNDRIGAASPAKEKGSGGAFWKYYTHIIAMFLLMTAFLLYPANFAIVTAAEGIIPAKYTSVIMAGMDLVAFFGGLLFVSVKKLGGNDRDAAHIRGAVSGAVYKPRCAVAGEGYNGLGSRKTAILYGRRRERAAYSVVRRKTTALSIEKSHFLVCICVFFMLCLCL